MKKKILVLAIAVALIAVAAIGGSLAWLTSTDEAENTFTVGDVKIELTEPKWDKDKNNLVPGTTILKDPTVKVELGSEPCYVRLLVTVNKVDALDKIFNELAIVENGQKIYPKLTDFFAGYNADNWSYIGKKDNSDDTRTYEFRYIGAQAIDHIVDASAAAKELEPLFTAVTVPGTVTGKQLATLEDFQINVVAEAIQSANMASEDNAWLAFPTK